jgi:hypothetical protein
LFSYERKISVSSDIPTGKNMPKLIGTTIPTPDFLIAARHGATRKTAE